MKKNIKVMLQGKFAPIGLIMVSCVLLTIGYGSIIANASTMPEQDMVATKIVVPVPAVSQKGLELPDIDTSNKTYMDYRKLTSESSTQYSMQQTAITDENGFRRFQGMYMIALGTYYSDHAGAVFHITLVNGTEFNAVTGDVKDDGDTDSKKQHSDGNVVEFIVDSQLLHRDARLMGDVSFCPGQGLMGPIAAIEYVGEVPA